MDRLDWNQSEKPLRLTRWVNFVGQVSVELARAQANKTPGNTVNKTSTLTSGPADLKDYIYDNPWWANSVLPSE